MTESVRSEGTPSTSAKKPFHEVVAETLIQQIEDGTAPWQKPWSMGAGIGFMPMNPSTGGSYRGINAIHLMAQGRADSRWLTYKQAQAMNAQVKKGERGTQIQYWKFEDLKPAIDAAGKPVKDEKGQTVHVRIKLESPRVFYATVFNAEQIDGLPELVAPTLNWDPIERAEHILVNSGAVIHHKAMDRAYYSVSQDEIHLPLRAQFETASHYYATALHELGHWSGHESRLQRDLKHPFGSEGYAREELRAEIASLMLSAELGLPHDPSQHASYVASWVKVLKKDPLEIFRAASDAQKIHTFITGMEPELNQTVNVPSVEDVALSISERLVPLPIVQRMTQAAVLAEVDNRISQFAHQPTIVVRPTAKGVLPGARDGDSISGAVHDGKIFLFLDQLGSANDVGETLFHELLHYGLRKIFSRDQFTAEMHKLYQRDAWIKDRADAWAKTHEGLIAKNFGGADYALARGVDEALARLAEPNAGEFTRTDLYNRTVQNVTRWMADLAQTLGFKDTAAKLRGIKNHEARELIQGVFERLKTDPSPTSPEAWESTDTAYSKKQSQNGMSISDASTTSSAYIKDLSMSSEDKTEQHSNDIGNENKLSRDDVRDAFMHVIDDLTPEQALAIGEAIEFTDAEVSAEIASLILKAREKGWAPQVKQPQPEVQVQAASNAPAPELQIKARLSIEATNHWLMSVPYGQLELEATAPQMIADDVKALAGITHVSERHLALLAMGHSAHEHKFYAQELEKLAPEISVEASEHFRLELAQRAEGLTQEGPAQKNAEGTQTQEVEAPQAKTDPTGQPQPKFDSEEPTHDLYNDLNLEGLASKRARDQEKTRQEMGLGAASSSTQEGHAQEMNGVSQAAHSIDPSSAASDEAELWIYQVHQKLAREYQYDGVSKYYFKETTGTQLAFEDRGTEVVTPHHSAEVVGSLAMLVHAKGWKDLHLKGTPEFKREMWLQASLLGLNVTGYTPEPIDVQRLKERQTTQAADARRTAQGVPQMNSVQAGHEPVVQPVADEQILASKPESAPVAIVKQMAGAIHDQLRSVFKNEGGHEARVVKKALADLDSKIVTQRTYVGELLAHGAAPYKFDKDEKESYYVKLKTASGEQTIWGVDLARAMEDLHAKGPVAGPIILAFQGAKAVKTSVRVRDAQGNVTGWEPTVVNRNEWFAQSVMDAYALAKQDIELDPEYKASVPMKDVTAVAERASAVTSGAEAIKAAATTSQDVRFVKSTSDFKSVISPEERIRRALGAMGVQDLARKTTVAALSDLYASPKFHVGTMVEHGAAPYAFQSNGPNSYYARLATENGEVLIWGADLARAVRNQVLEGQTVVVAYRGLESVSDADGPTTRRNDWLVAPLKTLHEDAQQGVVHTASTQPEVDAPDFSFMNKRDRQSMEVLAQAMRLAKVPDEIAADTLKQAQGLIQSGPKPVKTSTQQPQAKVRSTTPSVQRKAAGPSL